MANFTVSLANNQSIQHRQQQRWPLSQFTAQWYNQLFSTVLRHQKSNDPRLVPWTDPLPFALQALVGDLVLACQYLTILCYCIKEQVCIFPIWYIEASAELLNVQRSHWPITLSMFTRARQYFFKIWKAWTYLLIVVDIKFGTLMSHIWNPFVFV